MTEPNFLLPSQATRAPSGNARPAATAPDEAAADWLAPVAYDQWRRYLLPVPGGDPAELEPWTRVTTLSKLVGSEHGLTIWGERNLLRGVGMRASLRALLADGYDDKAVLDEVREAAKEAAGMFDARRYGTAVHTGVEACLLGRRALPAGVELDEQYGRDVLAAVERLRQDGVRIVAVERVVVHETLRYAGRLDYLAEVDLPATPLRQAQTVLRVIDLKTGARILEQGQQVGAQLSGYVNATHLYDPATRTFSPLPDVDRAAGYVLAVKDGRAQLHEVDLLDGWIDMRLAIQQHRRGKAGTSMQPVGAPFVVEAPETTAVDWRVAETGTSTTPNAFPVVEVAPAATWAPTVVDSPTAAQAVADAVQDVASLNDASAPAPVVEPERSPSGRARRACSKCRKPGHTAKRCPGVVQAEADALQAEVDPGAPVPTTVEEIVEAGTSCACSSPAGWTALVGASRPDVSVCGSCGFVSMATLERLTGERAGLTGLQEQAAVPSPALIAEARAIEAAASLAPAFVPPWQAPAPVVEPTLLERIDACTSQEVLAELWKANADAWDADCTARAQARISAGLPVLPGE